MVIGRNTEGNFDAVGGSTAYSDTITKQIIVVDGKNKYVFKPEGTDIYVIQQEEE